jgi:hypothetical protein
MEDKIKELIASYNDKISVLNDMHIASIEDGYDKNAVRYRIKIGVYRTFINDLERLLK